jgi:hypothetical protein
MLLETELGQRVEQKLQETLEQTRLFLEENRHEVLAVAHALETHKTVSGDDVIAIIEGKQGPIIDGRPYQDPAFRELAESYHRQAVAAHRGHSNVDAKLPELAALPAGDGSTWDVGASGNGELSASPDGGNGQLAEETEPAGEAEPETEPTG